MVSDVPVIRTQGRTVEAMPMVTPPGAESVQLNQLLGQSMNALSEGIFQQVEKNTLMEAQVSLSKGLARIEQDNMGNPEGMAKSLEAFKKGFLKEVRVPTLRQNLEYQFEVQSQPALNRAAMQFRQNLDQNTQVNTFLSFDEIQSQMDAAAQSAMSDDPHTAQSSVRLLQDLMVRQQALANQRSSDGSYLFSPEAVANMTIAARDKTHTALVRSWFNKQPNKLQAAEDWLNGAVEYDLPNSEDARGGFTRTDINHIFDVGVIGQESGGNQGAVSPKGATGAAQIMPETGPEAAKMAGVEWDPVKFKNDKSYNIKLGKAYFSAQVEKYGDPTLALMAYNAGPGAVDDFMNGTNNTGKNPEGKKIGNPANGETSVNAFVAAFPFKETRDYVRGVKEKSGFSVVNVRDTMPATTRQKVDNEIMSILNDQMAIENHKMVMEERANKNLAQNTFTSWVQELTTAPTTRTIDDVLSDATGTKSEPSRNTETSAEDFMSRRADQIARLDAQKQVFLKGGMQDEYMALRKSLVSGTPIVEDGSTVIQMQNMIARGADVSSMALSALNGNRIGTETYNQILTRQEKMRGPAGDATTFLLKQVQSGVAGINPSADPSSAILAYNAQTMFLDAAERWQQNPENQGKVPTIKDLKPFADDAIRQYSTSPTEYIQALDKNLPSYIPANLWSNKTKENVEKMKLLVRDNYTKKYGQNLDKIMNDPDARRDFEWVKQIEKQVITVGGVGD